MLFMYENTILPLRDDHSSSGLWPRVYKVVATTGHCNTVNLLPQAFGTILDCFMSLDFNNMIVRRVRGGAR